MPNYEMLCELVQTNYRNIFKVIFAETLSFVLDHVPVREESSMKALPLFISHIFHVILVRKKLSRKKRYGFFAGFSLRFFSVFNHFQSNEY
jgi:hypothetical protein